MKARQTAYKVWIRDIHCAEKSAESEENAPYLSIGGRQVVRVQVFGSVVNSSILPSYGSIMLDDGSGTIRVKAWGEDVKLLEGLLVSDWVFLVCRWAEFEGERYLRLESVRKVSVDWALCRRLELLHMFGAPKKEERVEVSAHEDNQKNTGGASLVVRGEILALLEDIGEVEEKVILNRLQRSGEEVRSALSELVAEGEVFCPRKGYYSILR